MADLPARFDIVFSPCRTVCVVDVSTPAGAGCLVPQTVLAAVSPGPAPAPAVLPIVVLRGITVTLLHSTLTLAGRVLCHIGRHHPVSVVDGVDEDEGEEECVGVGWLAGEERVRAAARAALHSGTVWVQQFSPRLVNRQVNVDHSELGPAPGWHRQLGQV